MLKVLYHIYFFRFSSSTIDSYHVRICVRLANFLLRLYYSLTGNFTRKRRLSPKESPKLIVSLTTYPARIEKLWLVIETLLDQTHKPDAIMLWLSEDEFPDEKSIPQNLRKLKERGVNINFCKHNLMPHKKYFYTMFYHPDSIVITVDDDVFYHPRVIEILLKSYKKYPDAISCSVIRKINIKDGRVLPYKKWNHINNNTEPDFRNHIIGVGGALYPAGSLHQEVFNERAIQEHALKTDDLWLKAMSLKQNTKVASVAGEYERNFITLIHRNKGSLMDSNIGGNNNDKNFSKILKYCGWDSELPPQLATPILDSPENEHLKN